MKGELPRDRALDAGAEVPTPEVESNQGYRLCVVGAERLPRSFSAVRRWLDRRAPADGDVAIARFQKALQAAVPSTSSHIWAAPAERIHRGVRLRLEAGAGVDAVIDIEMVARRHGLMVVDEELEEICFPCRFGDERHCLDAARTFGAAADGYLLIEGGPEYRWFVQVYSQHGSPQLRAEAVGNRNLGPHSRLPRGRVAALRRRGWRPPRGADVNHFMTLPRGGAADAEHLTALLRGTLADVYGLVAADPIVICMALG